MEEYNDSVLLLLKKISSNCDCQVLNFILDNTTRQAANSRFVMFLIERETENSRPNMKDNTFNRRLPVACDHQ